MYITEKEKEKIFFCSKIIFTLKEKIAPMLGVEHR